MENEYREILLLSGLDEIKEEELKRFKFLVPNEFEISRSRLEEATNRTELADQLIQSAGPASAVTKTIHIFRKLSYMHAANRLEEQKQKVDQRSKTTKKKGTQKVEKRSQDENCPGASATSRDAASKKHSATEVCPQAKPQKTRVMAEQEAIREGLQKDPLALLVLKATIPFECETREGKQMIFHATVATETNFFFVKVLDAQFKDKFTPQRTIKISNYLWYNNFLEVTSSSTVVEADADHQVCVPNNIKDKAGRTPMIKKLKTQPPGTIVNGIFKVQKIIEQRTDRVLYRIHDNTEEEMDVLVLGNQNQVKCEEGDKLRLIFFEVSKSGEKIQLKSGPHSFFKVIKATKPKK
ncbi:interferon-inducible protein AIM2 [Cricetulus griseus]|uniref:Absent in melanoma 2 n=1 Tax=Cricetulus griseus TaxID=10029 RepID=G3H811_CRIGR|nr:interferon-inducible protein AIM2 [Cricetulus griseus]XP_007639174.1 interferon-inducible protein AIM2 [Cricetulus griseus]XP_007639175.1 interferon-inducible protein AIM2 [Cricetulus griseus]XP_007639176.1 interferon-inducible protein AIM2 [Cricetulus griseus]XP_007639177.1 interferon-inducible protein AIM2 [Cricetulus griseus]XP_027274726.1 interferon-inducible protein AIM2 [Cricetulus griseus]XP_027274727.1 interferon-inducible protein AIM2 [Cricetulus griseus]XP_027274728.1 interferon